MSKIFDYKEFVETAVDCDVQTVITELVEWRDHLEGGVESDRQVQQILEEVIELVAENCTYERAR